MKQLKFFVFLSFSFSLLLLNACKSDDDSNPSGETITVSGTVSDDTGTILEGVTVTSVSTGTNTQTDVAGGYSINVASDDILSFSKDGYVTIDLSVTANLDVTINRSPSILFEAYFEGTGNSAIDPGFGAHNLQPSNSLGDLSTYPSGFDNVNYKGAVDPSGAAWYQGWSFFSNIISGNLESNPINLGNIITITDANMIAAGDNVNWTKDNTYVLDGRVFVQPGQILTIEAGTVIQAKPGEDVDASALIVARGAKIIADGKSDAPIIFTYEGDTGNSRADLRGQWGGLIILGAASLNSTPGESSVEGIPDEAIALYGGNQDGDDSGILRYVSIRHGGTLIGADNEINGLTLGGVGNGTTIEYVEVIGNKDDGIEWFGGTVNTKYVISAYCADDALDYDEGYRGQNQFIIVMQDDLSGAADRGGEHDGGTDPETAMPYATPLFYNITSIGNPESRAITFRDNAGGEYHNSIFMNYSKAVDVEDLEDQDQDSYKQWLDGNLKIENNVFYNIGAGATAKELFIVKN